jgi:hypothetical protein
VSARARSAPHRRERQTATTPGGTGVVPTASRGGSAPHRLRPTGRRSSRGPDRPRRRRCSPVPTPAPRASRGRRGWTAHRRCDRNRPRRGGTRWSRSRRRRAKHVRRTRGWRASRRRSLRRGSTRAPEARRLPGRA